MTTPTISISVIIPARDASLTLKGTLESVVPLVQSGEVEVIVVNDAGEKTISDLAANYPVFVVKGNGRGAASARNVGVQKSRGTLIFFTDADCIVSPEWLKVHKHVHGQFGDMVMVGGSIAIQAGASFWARCDHYCSWYNVHPSQPSGWVPNHPSANISVARSTLERVGPFREDLPRAGVHEETEWQSRLFRLGGRIRFEPRAVVWHVDRADFKSFIRHNYRWGYNSLMIKRGDSVSRFPWLFRWPRFLIVAFLPFAIAHTLFTVHCWVKAGKLEPLLLSPFLFLGRLAYASGLAIGGIRTLGKKREI